MQLDASVKQQVNYHKDIWFNKMQLQENEILYKETLLMCKLDTWSIEELKSWIDLQQQIVIKYTLKGYLIRCLDL